MRFFCVKLFFAVIVAVLFVAFQAATALAGPGMIVGADEDSLVWGSAQQPASNARALGLKAIRITRQWHPGESKVPADFQDASRDASRELSGDVSGDLSRDMSRVIKPLEDAIAALREQQDHERRAWRDERTRLMAERDHAEQGREGERARADELRDRIEVMAADLAAARGAEDRARAETDLIARKVNELTKANEARRARGRWARLRAAWRGE